MFPSVVLCIQEGLFSTCVTLLMLNNTPHIQPYECTCSMNITTFGTANSYPLSCTWFYCTSKNKSLAHVFTDLHYRSACLTQCMEKLHWLLIWTTHSNGLVCSCTALTYVISANDNGKVIILQISNCQVCMFTLIIYPQWMYSPFPTLLSPRRREEEQRQCNWVTLRW